MSDEKIKTGLWKKTMPDGTDILSGKILIPNVGEYWVSVYKNTKPSSENSPLFNAYLKPVAPKPQNGGHQAAQQSFQGVNNGDYSQY